jgi:TonB family protein
MLVEPAEYSAWTLFGEAVDADPESPAAMEGLEQVATALLGRGRTAFEQGRLDDAESVATTIVARLPEHRGALALAADIAVARTPPPVVERARPAPAAARAPPRPTPAERIPGMHAAFLEAMGRNAVLTPSGTSARDVVGEMIAIAPGHELTGAARELLVTELLGRSAQALEALDTAGAQAWIDAAAPLATDPAEVARAQQQLTRYLIETESKKRLPVSELEQTVRVAAEYPATALDRDIEGWVDVEFVVTPEGDTADITVAGASHERYFRTEAVAAVEQWRFEPVVFMGQPIPQRAYTRIEFVLN